MRSSSSTTAFLPVIVREHQEIAGRLENSATERRSLALVPLVLQKPDARVFRRQPREFVAGPIRRTIVDDHQLFLDRTEIDGEDSLD